MDAITLYATERGAANLPASTQAALFTISDYIRVHSIVGVVTTIIQTQANATKLVSNPTTGADVDLCVALDITADAVGTMYTITGDPLDTMIFQTSGAIDPATLKEPFVLAPGTLDLDCAATNTGQIKWTIIWSPVMASASVSAA